MTEKIFNPRMHYFEIRASLLFSLFSALIKIIFQIILGIYV